MTPVTWFLVGLGTLLGLGFAVAVWVDVWLEKTGRRTISERLLSLGLTKPYTAAIIGLLVGIIIGGLAVHLWWPIYLSQ